MVIYIYLDLVDLTSVRGFAFNFYFIILLGRTGLVLIFVSVVSSTFNKLPFVLIREFVGIHNVVANLTRATNYLGYFVALDF